jgi:hypothetical protein
MISDLAIIAFATKNVSASRKNILTDLCCGDAEDDARDSIAYLINFVNTQLPET